MGRGDDGRGRRSRSGSRERNRGRNRERKRSRSPSPSRGRERGNRRSDRSRGGSPESARDDSRERERKRRLAQKLAKRLEEHQEQEGDPDAPRQRFVWAKKIERDIVERGLRVEDFKADAEQRRMEERLREIEKVKKLQEQRERERQEREIEKELLNREKARAEAAELDRKETLFHLKTAVDRSEIRLSEQRPKPIDVLVKNILLGERLGVDTSAPYRVFDELNAEETEELRNEIREFVELDTDDPLHREYWSALSTVADHELEAKRRVEAEEQARIRGTAVEAPRGDALAPGVEEDVQEMLQGKNFAELQGLRAEVQGMLQSGEADDPEYWGAVLHRLTVHVARARVREIHADILDRHIARTGAGADTVVDLGALRREKRVALDAAASQVALPPPPPLPGTTANAEEIPLDDEEGGEAGGASGGARAVNADADAGGVSGAVGEEEFPLPDPGEFLANAEEIDIGDEEEGDGDGDGGGGASGAGDRGVGDAGGAREGERGGDGLAVGPAPAPAAHPRTEPGRWSPPRVPIPPDAEVVLRAHDARELEYLRAQVRFRAIQRFRAAAAAAAMAAPAPSKGKEKERGKAKGGLRGLVRGAEEEGDRQSQALWALAMKMMESDTGADLDLSSRSEVALDSQVFWWHDKYKPRKPKYFNRVHTGFEWSKYNRAHFDSDNMPPKVVQGYKFNIFYPDLIDKSSAPTYVLERDPESADGSTCMIRFKAGAPYEDIAFRIVNKEWEYTAKRGFKCVFERGILHLYFNFKRTGYRR